MIIVLRHPFEIETVPTWSECTIGSLSKTSSLLIIGEHAPKLLNINITDYFIKIFMIFILFFTFTFTLRKT